MTARLDFTLTGAGWASLEISSDDFRRRIDGISYLSDALDDLLRMGIDIATDKGWSFAEFDHEPAVTVLVAETGWWDGDQWILGARLSSFDNKAGAVDWQRIHNTRRDFVLPVGSRDELAALFLGAAERVLEQYGEPGFAKAWGGRLAFPVRAMEALRTALNCPSLPAPNYRA